MTKKPTAFYQLVVRDPKAAETETRAMKFTFTDRNVMDEVRWAIMFAREGDPLFGLEVEEDSVGFKLYHSKEETLGDVKVWFRRS